MNKSLEQVKQWFETFGHPVGDVNVPETLQSRQLRVKLIFEELAELALASDVMKTFATLCWAHTDPIGLAQDGNDVNKLEEFDALCDIQYVNNGAIISKGFHPFFDKGFDRVHHNNMSKAHLNVAHAEATITQLGNPPGYEIFVKPDGSVLLYNESKKLVKPHDHKKVALTIY